MQVNLARSPRFGGRPGAVLLIALTLAFTTVMQLLSAGSAYGGTKNAARSGPAEQSRAPVVPARIRPTMVAGDVLLAGWRLAAPGGRVVMTMQGDGNLVVTRNGAFSWASFTQGHRGAFARMQLDGNFVIYTRHGRALWSTRSEHNIGAYATLQADGYFVVYSRTKTPLWWRDIGRGAALCNTTRANPEGGRISRWNPVTLCVLKVLRQSARNLSDVNLIIRYESGGNPNAINLYDINAQRGHPSKGLIQVIQSTFNRFRSHQLSANMLNPAANLYAGLNYAIYTYGSIHNVPGLVSLRNGGGYKGYVLHG